MSDTDYEKAKERIEEFLTNFFSEDDNGLKKFKYQDKIKQLAERQQVALYVDQDDVYVHDPELYDWINGNTIRYRQLFSAVVQKLVQDAIGDNPVRFDSHNWFGDIKLLSLS